MLKRFDFGLVSKGIQGFLADAGNVAAAAALQRTSHYSGTFAEVISSGYAKRKSALEKLAAVKLPLGSSTRMENAFPAEL